MPLFSDIAIRISPRLLRAVRIYGFLPMVKVMASLPVTGRVLDVGCGYGHVISFLAEQRPDLHFLGTDTDHGAIRRCKMAWGNRPNLCFESSTVSQLSGTFNHVLLLDVMHHMTHQEESDILSDIAAVLIPNGSLLVKEMDSGRCALGVALDTYVSQCPPRVHTREEICNSLSQHFCQLRMEAGSIASIGYVLVHAVRQPKPFINHHYSERELCPGAGFGQERRARAIGLPMSEPGLGKSGIVRVESPEMNEVLSRKV